jgi:hypothetical protein
MSSSASPFAIFGDAFAHLRGVIENIANGSKSDTQKAALEEAQASLEVFGQSMNQAMEIRRQEEEAEEQRKAEEKRQAEEAEEQRKLAEEAEEQRRLAEVAGLEGEVAAKRQALNALLKRAAALQNLIIGAEGDELMGFQRVVDACEKKIDDATAALAKAEEELAAVKPAQVPNVPSAQPAAVFVQAYPAPSGAQTNAIAHVAGADLNAGGSSSTEPSPSPQANVAGKKRKRNPSKNATIQEWKTAILRVVASKNADGTDTYPSCVDGFKLWLACTNWEDMLCAVPDLVKEGCITQTPLAIKLKQFYNVYATDMVSKNQMTPKFHNGQLSLAKRVVCDAHELVTQVPKKRKSGVHVSVDGGDQPGNKRKRSKKNAVEANEAPAEANQ